MKKFLSILLILAMVLSFGVTAFADDVIELKLADNGADNMPAKWHILILLGQETILKTQQSPSA